MTIVAKFGGTSMATAESIRAVAAILEQDPARSICVVSAPGKIPGGMKLTDLLINDQVTECTERVICLVQELELGSKVLARVLQKLRTLHLASFAPARMAFGEWLSAYLLTQITGRRFIDANRVVFFSGDLVRIHVCWEPYEQVIIPGFYGYDIDDECVRTFPRGGSDITASLIAAAVSATLCENWTDVSGVFDRDPNHYPSAKQYPELSYNELLNVAHGGAQIFHQSAIAPLMETGIPLHIRSTFAPHVTGTLVT